MKKFILPQLKKTKKFYNKNLNHFTSFEEKNAEFKFTTLNFQESSDFFLISESIKNMNEAVINLPENMNQEQELIVYNAIKNLINTGLYVELNDIITNLLNQNISPKFKCELLLMKGRNFEKMNYLEENTNLYLECLKLSNKNNLKHLEIESIISLVNINKNEEFLKDLYLSYALLTSYELKDDLLIDKLTQIIQKENIKVYQDHPKFYELFILTITTNNRELYKDLLKYTENYSEMTNYHVILMLKYAIFLKDIDIELHEIYLLSVSQKRRGSTPEIKKIAIDHLLKLYESQNKINKINKIKAIKI